MIAFIVRGLPAPQGSKRAFRNKHTGRVMLVESSPKVKPWRSDVRDAALAALDTTADGRPITAPVGVALSFHMPRPKGHYGSGRNADRLKASAPEYPATKPDLDKLVRAVLDSLTGLVWVDDSQVVSVAAEKLYADENGPGLHVLVDVAGRTAPID